MLPINLLNILKQYHQGRAVCFTDWNKFLVQDLPREIINFIFNKLLFLSLCCKHHVYFSLDFV